MNDQDLIGKLAVVLVEELLASRIQVATAESCTGGWIAKALTDVAGSSGCFGYGVVTYSNTAKETLLGVDAATLASHGAVSEPVVRLMVKGALDMSNADLAVAVSGIAGPDGGTAGKPVGTVWFGFGSQRDGRCRVDATRQQLRGDREAIRTHCVLLALEGLYERATGRG